ncbi:hypothetical protein [Acaryochloris sp. IP29b_bin.148]|uniref:hypothetical protein n=1 Tax=Acaryochloris sp. IP29b_bin.148 TaxID=2969218 RepID=UPI0026356ABD|nr:hypothetical protein [Acaryochloris sp. IP29b_bin.148]
MNKTVLCLNVVCTGTLFIAPSLAQSSLDKPITEQPTASSRTTGPLRSHSINCSADYPRHNRPSHTPAPVSPSSVPKKITTAPAVWQDLRSHHLSQPTTSSASVPSKLAVKKVRNYQSISIPQPVIVEAQGWTRDQKGRIVLTAKLPKVEETASLKSAC